eukprot:359137-Chlamydomonas_euryale.AAC.8
MKQGGRAINQPGTCLFYSMHFDVYRLVFTTLMHALLCEEEHAVNALVHVWHAVQPPHSCLDRCMQHSKVRLCPPRSIPKKMMTTKPVELSESPCKLRTRASSALANAGLPAREPTRTDLFTAPPTSRASGHADTHALRHRNRTKLRSVPEHCCECADAPPGHGTFTPSAPRWLSHAHRTGPSFAVSGPSSSDPHPMEHQAAPHRDTVFKPFHRRRQPALPQPRASAMARSDGMVVAKRIKRARRVRRMGRVAASMRRRVPTRPTGWCSYWLHAAPSCEGTAAWSRTVHLTGAALQHAEWSLARGRLRLALAALPLLGQRVAPDMQRRFPHWRWIADH